MAQNTDVEHCAGIPDCNFSFAQTNGSAPILAASSSRYSCGQCPHPKFSIWTSGSLIVRFAFARHNEFYFEVFLQHLVEKLLLLAIPWSERRDRSLLPDFTASDIEVNVEPRRVIINGKRESKRENKKGHTTKGYCDAQGRRS
jgi:hypothetical protein